MEKGIFISNDRSSLNSIFLRLDSAYTILGNLPNGGFSTENFEDLMHHRKILKDMMADIESIQKSLP